MKKILFLASCILGTFASMSAMKTPRPTPHPIRQLSALEFAEKTEYQVYLLQKYLNTALTKHSPKQIALVLNIENTCILSKGTYNWLDKNLLTQACDKFANSFSYNESRKPIITAVLNLAQWASQNGIQVYYLTSYAGLPEDYERDLRATGYPVNATSIICINQTAYNEDLFEIEKWKKNQLNQIQKAYTALAFIDENYEGFYSTIENTHSFSYKKIIM